MTGGSSGLLVLLGNGTMIGSGEEEEEEEETFIAGNTVVVSNDSEMLVVSVGGSKVTFTVFSSLDGTVTVSGTEVDAVELILEVVDDGSGSGD